MIFKLIQFLLFALCIWAIFKGGWPERWGAILLFVDLAFRAILNDMGFPLNFYSPKGIYLLTTGLLFLASVTLAIKSNRLWPLFFSAFCLVQFAGHFAAVILQAGYDQAYWAMTQIPFLIQTLVLGLGTLAVTARCRKGVLANDWC